MSIEADTYRRWWPIFTAADITDNVLTAAGDYTRFERHCADRSAAAERRRIQRHQALQHHRGARRARTNNLQMAANDFGAYSRYWDGIDVTAQRPV